MPQLAPHPVTLSRARHIDMPTCPDGCELHCRARAHFMTMLSVFLPTGGMAPVQDVAARFEHRNGPALSVLHSWIAARALIGFEWRSEIWVPWFQFSQQTMSPHRSLRAIFEALSSVHEPWEMANWFASPNHWLGDRIPVDMLLTDLPSVLRAAKVDQYIANG